MARYFCHKAKIPSFLIILLSIVLSGCSKNISDDYSSVARDCAVDSDDVETDVRFIKLESPLSKTALISDFDVTLVTKNSSRLLPINREGCVAVNPDDKGVIAVSYSSRWFGKSETNELSPNRLNKIPLFEVNNIQADFGCSQTGLFFNKKVSLPINLSELGNSRLLELNLDVVRPDDADWKQTIPVKPFGDTWTDSGLVEFDTLAQEGRYIVSLTANGPKALVRAFESTNCIVSIVRSAPQLVIDKSIQESLLEITVGRFSFIPISASQGSYLQVCRKTDDSVCQPGDFKTEQQIVFSDSGIYYLSVFAEDQARNRSEIWQRVIRVDDEFPLIKARFNNPDLQILGQIQRRPSSLVSVTAELSDDLDTKEQLTEKLQCRLRIVPDPNTEVKGSFATCRSPECAGQSLGDYINCPAHLTFDLGQRNWDIITDSKMFVDFRVSDSLGQTSHFQINSNFSSANSYRWEAITNQALGLAESVPNTNLNKSYRDSSGKLWFYNFRHVFLQEDSGWTWFNLFKELDDIPHPTLSIQQDAQITQMTVDSDQAFWLATSKGIYYYKSDEETIVYQKESFSNPEPTFNRFDTIWLMNEGKGVMVSQNGYLYSLAGQTFQGHPCNTAVQENLRNMRIEGLQGDENQFWAFTRLGIIQFSNEQCDFESYPKHPDGRTFSVTTYQDVDQRVWVSWENSLFMYENRKKVDYSKALETLGINKAITATIDTSRRLWIGSTAAVARLNTDLITYESFTPAVMGVSDVDEGRFFPNRITADSKGIWINGSPGLFRSNLSLEPWSKITDSAIIRRFVSAPDGSLSFSNWSLFTLTNRGLETRNEKNSDLPVWFIRDFEFDSTGSLVNIIGESFQFGQAIDTLATKSTKGWTTHIDFNDQVDLEMGDDATSILTDDSGVVWFAYEKSGVVANRNGVYSFYPEASGNRLVKDPSGNIWLAGRGLYLFNPDEDRWIAHDHSADTNIPLTFVRNIMIDDQGKIWAHGYLPGTVENPDALLGDAKGNGRLMTLTDGTWVLRPTPLDETDEKYGLIRAGSDEEGRLWVMGAEKDFAVFDQGNWVTFTTDPFELKSTFNDDEKFVVTRHQGYFYFWIKSRGILRYDHHLASENH